MRTSLTRSSFNRSFTALTAGLGLLALATLTGCSASSPTSMPVTADMGFSEAAPGEMNADLGKQTVQQQVIRTGTISLVSDNVLESMSHIEELVTQYSGSIDQQDIRTSDDRDYGYMTVRVPASELESFMTDVREVDETVGFSVSDVDVTLSITDLDARISALNTSISKLEQLQEQATSVTDLVAVEAELATRTAERDSLVAQRDMLENQVAMSTVYIDISPDPTATTDSPDFIGGIESGWNALINLGAGAVTLVGFLIPMVLGIGIVVAALIVIVRLIRRARQRK